MNTKILVNTKILESYTKIIEENTKILVSTVNTKILCDTWRFLYARPTRRFRLDLDSAVDCIFILLYLIAV